MNPVSNMTVTYTQPDLGEAERMQRLIEWLGNLVSPEQAAPAKPSLRVTQSLQRQAQVRRRTEALTEMEPAAPPAELYTAGGSRIEDGGPGKNILSQPKFVREETGTHETLKIVDSDLIDTGEEAGFDPYNTGRFDRSANWGKNRRK